MENFRKELCSLEVCCVWCQPLSLSKTLLEAGFKDLIFSSQSKILCFSLIVFAFLTAVLAAESHLFWNFGGKVFCCSKNQKTGKGNGGTGRTPGASSSGAAAVISRSKLLRWSMAAINNSWLDALHPPSSAEPPHEVWKYWHLHDSAHRQRRLLGWGTLEPQVLEMWEKQPLYGGEEGRKRSLGMFKSAWQKGWRILGASGGDGLGMALERSTGEAGELTWEHHAPDSKATSAQLFQPDPGQACREGQWWVWAQKAWLTLLGRLAWLKCGKQSRSPVSRRCAAVDAHRGSVGHSPWVGSRCHCAPEASGV